MPEESPIPTLLAFLVCDTVIHDQSSQKKSLVGLFDQVLSGQVPITLHAVGLYAKMVEGSGPYEVKVRLVNLQDEAPVMEVGVKTHWKDPDAPMELGINMQGSVVLPAFGTYEFQLYANNVFLGRAVVKASELKPPTGPTAGPSLKQGGA